MDGFIERQDDPTNRYHDIIVYDRQLTEDETSHYSLDLIQEGNMTLYDILPKDGSETTVIDNTYDMETYFYYSEEGDAWDNAMMDLAKLLQVVEPNHNGSVMVDFTSLIEPKLPELIDLFIDCDMDAIMDDMDNILAGNVSEKWLIKFVEILGR